MLRRALVLAAVVGISLPLVTAADAAEPAAGLRAGAGVADATWHLGSGGGQYVSVQDETIEAEPLPLPVEDEPRPMLPIGSIAGGGGLLALALGLPALRRKP